MNKMTKHGIVGLLLILAIGFASITTTFIINGTTSIGTNDLDFDVYFSKVSTDIGGVAVIDTTTRKQITYSSKSLKSIGDTATLNYTVYNNSSQYDANVSVSFNAVNVVDSIDYTDYYSITRSGFDTNDYTLVSSKDSVDGTISINLLKPVLEDVEITFTLTLDGTATERASEGTPSSLDPTIYTNTKSASALVQDLGLGFNIGNNLDAIDQRKGYRFDMETYWHNPLITQNLLDVISDTGFKSIRLPVSYYNHIQDGIIDSLWLDRVEEVINYALNDDLYVILDIHHDASTNSNKWISADPTTYEVDSKNFVNLWNQIANRFKDYDYRLIFEAFNEISDAESNWSNHDAYPYAHNFDQLFIDTVRGTGGKNVDRFLMVSTYCSSTSSNRVKQSLTGGFNDMAEDKLLLSLHLYETDLTEIDSKMNKVVEYQNTYNIPAVITEFGVSAEEELSVRIAATQEMMNMYNSTGIPFIWWDNGKVDGYAIFDRTTGEVIRPQIVEILFGSN